MPASLSNQNISNTYKGLLHAQGDALPTTGNVVITDGYGQNSALSLGVANQGIKVSGPSLFNDVVADTLSLSGELYVGADNGITSINAPKAWALFSGNDGTLRAGYNVLPLPGMRAAVGEYLITFRNALPTEKYVVQTSLAFDNAGPSAPFMVCSYVMPDPPPTASSFKMKTYRMSTLQAPTPFDPWTVSITVYHA